ncbi:MAG: ammonium transporter [Rhodospirillales bacterium]|nr:ammonium transporter [Alphaproteobacteria bacterium]MCB9977336.1 ammonium transporter [Rhodospirillales bacterium]
MKRKAFFLTVLCGLLSASPAFAEEAAAPAFNSGDTAWMLVSALLVLMMTVPGLALFYGGLVKRDNVLATLMQSLAICAIVSVVWPVLGYTLAFGEGNGFIGGLGKAFLNGVTPTSASGTIPETVFIMFQMTFAVITTALLVGAVADRIKFTSLLVFTPLWVLCVYAPIAHWVWGSGGFIGGVGLEGYSGFLGMGTAIDFAGGTVVHINSGVAGLVAAIIIGRSLKADKDPSTSNNLILSVIGAGLLWVGWFGFNAGSALTAGSSAGYAMLVTNTAAGMAASVWMIIELMHKGKASVQGTLSGLVAGLVAITPAAGFVDFAGSLVIGVISAAVCYVSVAYLKTWFKYDDSLDVFGLHGVGGIAGALLTGVLANPEIGNVAGTLYGGDTQLIAQALSIVVVAAYSGVVTFVLLAAIKATIGLRVDTRIEYYGLDLALHGETAVEYDREVYAKEYGKEVPILHTVEKKRAKAA